MSSRKRTLFCATMLGGLAAAASAAAGPALPSGGHVQAGSASIGSAASTLTVSQTSSKAIIDWSSFGVGQGGTVQFDNGAGATLNRVTGTGVSSIDGLLSATGSVYLINPNGVIVGKTGVVNAGGSFVASTLDVANTSFLAGGPLTFAGPSTASVINLGKVGSLGGNVGLIAATVRNDGSIAAPKGEAGLTAGSTVTLDDAANDAGGLFSVKVGGASTSATNTGAISAAAVELRAQQGNVYALAGNTGGVINATGVDASGGTIKLISTGGTTEVAGTLSAQGPNGAGGQIETSGETLKLGAASVDTHGGSWLLDPTDLIVDATAATAIDGALGSGDVTLQTFATGAPSGPAGSTGDTAAGNGDIIIEHALTWATGSTLTLTAFNALDIDAPITVTGPGKAALNFGAGGLNFAYGPTAFTGNLAFTDVVSTVTQGGLTINGQAYVLENSVAGLSAAIAATPGGFFALANSYDATSDGTYASAPIHTTFTGTFEGLGNTISNLTIFSNAAPLDEAVGLFASVTGNISDLAISGGSVVGNANVGALAGFDDGNVNNVHASTPVTGFFLVGGLIGEFGQPGTSLANSSSTGAVTGVLVDPSSSGEPGAIGGLIGQLDAGSVTASYATGAVTALGGDQIGGLIGVSNGNNNVVVSNSYATGAVSAGLDPSTFTAGSSVGGLIGDNGGAVIDSYATGAVLGTQNVGGLIGINDDDAPGTSITNPTGDGTVVKSFATGAVTGYVDSFGNEGIDVGGLIGVNEGAVANAYAMGAVTGGDQLGGLVGGDEGSLSSVYSTGLVRAAVGATPTAIGGLIGEDDSGGGQIQFAYWDTVTSGQPTLGVGLFGTAGEVTGFATGDLQSTATVGVSLGAAFGGGAAGGENGVYPYLVDFFPHGVQAVSGFVYSDAAVTPIVGATVGVIANGVPLGTASTGFNGYYYIVTAAGGVPTGQSVLAYGNSPNAATLATSAGANNTSGVNLYGDALAGTSSDTTFDQLLTDFFPAFTTAAGGNSQALSAVQHANGLYLTATGAGFTLDEPFTASAADSMLVIQTTAANAPIVVARPITIEGTNELQLTAAGSLSIDAAISIAGGGAVSLTYGAAGLGFDLGPTGFGGSLSYAVGKGEGLTGQALTINGTPYDLLYSMADVSSIDGSVGAFALAAPVTATGTLAGAVNPTFLGTLEGLGNSISGLTINSAGNNVGLIGMLGSGGLVRDIGLAGAVSGVDDVGALVGINLGAITNVFIGANVSAPGGADVGGVVGLNAASGRITGVVASGATVSADGGVSIGGVVGYNLGSVSGSTAADTVDNNASGRATGGLVGYNATGSSVSDSSASGFVNGGLYIGGLAGYNNGSITGGSSASADLTSSAGYAGGLVGYNAGSGVISGASASSDVTGGAYYTGGMVGYNAAGGTITGGSAGGTVGGVNMVGGFAGYNAGAINGTASASDSVSTSGGRDTGGFVGYNAAGATITGATASGATVTGDGNDAVGGLAGYNGGSVSNATASDTIDNAGGRATGGLVGYAAGGSSVSASSASSGVVTGGAYTGGLAGYNDGSIIGASSATGDVTGGGDYAGGLVGYNAGSGTISGASAGGNVTGGAFYTGGMVGYNAASGTIIGGIASGTVSGANMVGGFVGFNAGSITGGGSATGDVSTSGGRDIGGFVGYNAASATITGATASGATVTGASSDAVGGLAGYNGGPIGDDAASDTVDNAGGRSTGGLVGYNAGSIVDAYAYAGPVTGGAYTGGLIGYNVGGVATSWSSGAVSGTTQVGGSIGDQFSGTISDVYWDEATSGLTIGTGAGASTGLTGIGGATGRDPHQQSTYVGFNFTTVWKINPGTSRPYLQSPAPATPPH